MCFRVFFSIYVMFLLYVYMFTICSCHVVLKVYVLTYLQQVIESPNNRTERENNGIDSIHTVSWLVLVVTISSNKL